jgi:hypothetical protein
MVQGLHEMRKIYPLQYGKRDHPKRRLLLTDIKLHLEEMGEGEVYMQKIAVGQSNEDPNQMHSLLQDASFTLEANYKA